uniref:C2H2-type domain-containing protein n=1 Tax=Caenorhabditis tropicalis TaxID=1561998 RepID=A0A1I7TBE8_9PELO
METDDSEIWSKNLKCLVCRISCEDEAKKTEHQETKEHMKRWKVKQFIDESLDRITTAVSQMHERYKLKKLPIIGLEECFEIQQEGLSDQEKANFWACNLCYEAGATYDSADIHLTSMQHIKNYLDENESDKNEKIEKECKNDECDKYEKYRAAAEEVFTANGGIKGIQSAQVLRLMLNTDDGRKKLGIEDQMEVTFRPCPKNAQKIILFCSTCNEVKPVHLSGKYTNEKACVNHCESLDHQRCSRIMAVMNEFEPQEIYDEYRTSETVSQLHWQEKKPGTWYLSQPCGYRYSIRAGKETMCTVCFALVKSENILEHFTSEFHIMKYLNMINSYHSYVTHQLLGTDRRAKALLTLKGTITLENDTKKIAQTLTRLPNFIKSQLMEDVHKYEDPPLEIIDDFIDSTGKVYRFCHSCTTFMEFDHNIVDTPIKMNFAWKSHVLSDHHFEIAAMRNRINFDPKYFVPYSPTIHNIDTEIKGVWKVDKDVLIQTQCDVGLEYMVEDEQANEVVCQCCWKIFSKNLVFVNQHIRSYEHLKQYIFMCAPNMVRTLLSPESDLNKQAFLMEYLQKSSGHFKKEFTCIQN